MSAAFHCALGCLLWMWLSPIIGWWSIPVIILFHVVDGFCLFHPPGVHMPWRDQLVTVSRWKKFRGLVWRVIMDEWQYDYCVDGEFSVFKSAKWLLFISNVVFFISFLLLTIFGVIPWLAFLAGFVNWLGFDSWWIVREISPRFYLVIARYNPHRLADWIRGKLKIPSDFIPGAIVEVVGMVLMMGLSKIPL